MTGSAHSIQGTLKGIFQWHSLKTKFTVFTLAMFLIGIWSLAFYASRMLHEDMQRLLGGQQFSTVSIIAAAIDNELQDRLKSLEMIAAKITPAMLGDTASIQKFLESQISFTTLFNYGGVVTRLDNVAIAEVPVSGRVGINYGDRDWIIEALKGKTAIGKPIMGKKSQAPAFMMVAPIRDAKGNVIGVLTGATDLAKPNFLSTLMDYRYGQTGGYLLVSPQLRKIVYATDKRRVMEVLPGPGINPLIDRFIQGYEGTGVAVNPLGVEVLASAKGIPTSGWYLTVLTPTEEAFAPFHDLQKRMIIATIFLTMLATGLAWWMLKHQLAPIFTTIKNLATLSEKEQSPQPLHITRQDEIGELIGGFNHLLENLRKREQKLKKTEERYQILFSRASDGIFIMSNTGKLVEVNESFARMHGYTKAEMLDMSLNDFDTPESFRAFPDRIQQLLAGKALTFEANHYHRDGHIFPLEVSASLISYDDESYIQCFHRDITERKQAEEEKRSMSERLQRAEKLEALGQLAGGVAHDLNNVLGVSTIYSELLQEQVPEGSPFRKYVDNILSSTQKGAAIIEDLLTLARRGVTVADVINLSSIVSNFLKSAEFTKIRAHHSEVTFKSESQEELLNIKGSPVHLDKTLMNLVLNAAEAINGRGEVAIRLENQYLDKPVRGYDGVMQGDYVVLTVSDTGMGIPAENIGKIFEPFYTKKTMGRSGTGLGLAIVWGAVKDHNGYIDVQTEVGKGTTFTLYFPVTREETTEQKQEVPIEQYVGKGESVLVVDDIAEQRDVASRLLTRLGYQVQSVPSGEEAVEYLKEHKTDILVLDMIMPPGIDGLETYQRVVEINPEQKAILVSGFSETDRVKEAQRLGAGTYVKKPYVMAKIGVAIRDELARNG